VATTSTLGVVQPDGTSITINSGVITATGVIPTTYITNAMIDGTAQNITYAHSLGTFPGFVHPILLCTTDDAGTGMVAGQMTEFTSVFNTDSFFGGASGAVFASVTYDTVNIYIQTTANPGDRYTVSPNGSSPISWNNFAIVVGFHQ